MTDGLTFRHPHVQRLRRLAGRRSSREEEGCVVVEGATLVGEAVRAGWHVEAQFVAPGSAVVDIGAAGTVHHLAPGVIERVSTTTAPQGVIAVVRRPDPSTAAASLRRAAFAVVVDRLADPGNLGTILRSAEAAGVEVVGLTPGSVDVFNPKVVRASAGAIFHVPVCPVRLDELGPLGFRVIGTSSHRGISFRSVDWSGRVAVVLGNEAHGLDDDAPIDEWATIEHRGRSESLNVAMAATVICLEAAARRAGAANALDRPAPPS